MTDLLNYRSRQSGDGVSTHQGTVLKRTYNQTKKVWSDWSVFSDISLQSRDISSQVTGSISHKRGRDGKYHSGGSFYTCRDIIHMPVGSFNGTYTFQHASGVPISEFKAEEWPMQLPKQFVELFMKDKSLQPRSKDLSDLDSFGATAISRCSPANPASELGTGVSETYREGLPSLPGIPTWRERTSIAKGAGSEYLNKVFGWDPLISEVKDFASVVRKHRDILNQYRRDEGKLVHRRYNFDVDSSETQEVIGTTPGYTGPWTTGTDVFPKPLSEPSEVSLIRGSSHKRWFSGAFTYASPSQSDSWRRALGYGSDADVLYGASLNPELLWNLTPWSWAVDWFSNTGDVINNISNYIRAGQIMQYGYMMEESTSYLEISVTGSQFPGTPAPPGMRREVVAKVRRPANPFGFGISLDSLSATQLAITAALGITLL